MIPVPLSDAERAALPPIRPRWLAHLGGLAGAAVGLGALVGQRRVLDALDLLVMPWDLPLYVALPLVFLTTLLPLVVVAPLLFKLGYEWFHVAVVGIIPPVAFFILWGVGFRLVRRPYRDWRPSPRQRPTARPVPGTGYHVLQADLDRHLRPSAHDSALQV